MNIQYRLKVFIAYLKANNYIKSQKELGYKLGFETESAFSQVVNNKVPLSETLYPKLKTLYPFLNLDWLIYEVGPMIEAEKNIMLPANSPKEALNSLNKLRKTKGRLNRTRIISDDEVVEAVQYVVPIPGQAGLKKAFFAPDEYIEQNFVKEVIHVKPSEKAVYHKIEVDGDSMPGIVDQGDWARCVDIPKTEWLEKGTFKPNRVYCLFHRYKGPLFKRITKTFLDSITLSSDNADKDEYPDEVFDLAEFSKILRVVVVEKRL